MKKDVNIKILMLFIVFTVFLMFSSLAVTASNETLDDLNLTSTYPIVDSYSDALVLFYSDTCPHCHEEIAFLNNEVKINYPGLKIKLFETSTSENRELFEKFAERYNSSSSGVPRTFINNKAFVGYSTENGTDEYVDSYKASIGFKNLLLEEVINNNVDNNKKDFIMLVKEKNKNGM